MGRHRRPMTRKAASTSCWRAFAAWTADSAIGRCFSIEFQRLALGRVEHCVPGRTANCLSRSTVHQTDRPPGASALTTKVLRLNVDATTPDDQPGFTPIYSLDYPQPKALASRQPASGNLWVIDGVDPSGGLLSAVPSRSEGARRAVPRVAYTLPQGTGASSAAFYRGDLIPAFRGDLFIAAETGRELMRLEVRSGQPGPRRVRGTSAERRNRLHTRRCRRSRWRAIPHQRHDALQTEAVI